MVVERLPLEARHCILRAPEHPVATVGPEGKSVTRVRRLVRPRRPRRNTTREVVRSQPDKLRLLKHLAINWQRADALKEVQRAVCSVGPGSALVNV